MVTDKNLTNLYEGIIKGKELTTKELKEYGFNTKDLTSLINENVLGRVKRGHYTLLDVDKLYLYGKKMMAMKEYKKSTICFEECCKFDKSHGGANFQIFLREVQNKNYEKAIEHFDKFYTNAKSKLYINDNNFYLYLLSMITGLPDNYQKIAKELVFDDIKVSEDDKRYSDISSENEIRTSALNQNFIFSIKKLNDRIKKNNKQTVQEISEKILLFQAVERQNIIEQDISLLVKNKEYSKLIEYLKKNEDKVNLSLMEGTILQLAMDLTNMLETGIVPQKTNFKSGNLYKAINNCNYDLALSLSRDYSQKNAKSLDDNLIYILLDEINKYIDKEDNVLKKQYTSKTY